MLKLIIFSLINKKVVIKGAKRFWKLVNIKTTKIFLLFNIISFQIVFPEKNKLQFQNFL